MTTTLQATSHQQTATARSHSLLSVIAWEARRLAAIRFGWAIPPFIFALFLIEFWPARQPQHVEFGTDIYRVAGTSAWGLVDLLPPRMFLLLALLLPFVSADGVARDLKRRTHELLMSTTLSARTYVWGRYIMVLLLSFGLALVLLAALLTLGFGMPLIDATYPAAQVGNIVILWAVIILPATALVSSVSFALGTLLPHHSNFVKVGVLLLWLAWAGIFTVLPDQVPLSDWQLALDPTSNGRSIVGVNQYFQNLLQQVSSNTSSAQIGHIFQTVEQRLPDLGAWLASQVIWVMLGLALVALVSFSFKRFRSAMN